MGRIKHSLLVLLVGGIINIAMIKSGLAKDIIKIGFTNIYTRDNSLWLYMPFIESVNKNLDKYKLEIVIFDEAEDMIIALSKDNIQIAVADNGIMYLKDRYGLTPVLRSRRREYPVLVSASPIKSIKNNNTIYIFNNRYSISNYLYPMEYIERYGTADKSKYILYKYLYSYENIFNYIKRQKKAVGVFSDIALMNYKTTGLYKLDLKDKSCCAEVWLVQGKNINESWITGISETLETQYRRIYGDMIKVIRSSSGPIKDELYQKYYSAGYVKADDEWVQETREILNKYMDKLKCAE